MPNVNNNNAYSQKNYCVYKFTLVTSPMRQVVGKTIHLQIHLFI